MLFSFVLVLSACTQLEEERGNSGIIVDDKVMGYEYTVTQDEKSFSWKVGYKGNITTMEESIVNKDDLENFIMAVGEGKFILSKLIISLSYFFIVVIIAFILYKKNRKTLKDSAIVLVLASMIALYIAIDASYDLSIELQDIKFHYLRLTTVSISK
ncbi:hypothetical protein [Paenibacillus sp. An7]|uniref:hypothetical protein n=1 Tax=Paenibacillus sp. An7 TaxID=2689577 RepID=UPI00135BE36A|nr:hypothetical protein [Paenibacillus sp. An7]